MLVLFHFIRGDLYIVVAAVKLDCFYINIEWTILEVIVVIILYILSFFSDNVLQYENLQNCHYFWYFIFQKKMPLLLLPHWAKPPVYFWFCTGVFGIARRKRTSGEVFWENSDPNNWFLMSFTRGLVHCCDVLCSEFKINAFLSRGW